jgi:serine/threonine protein kinase
MKDHVVDDGHKFIPFNENDLKEFFRALLKAVNYCHNLEPDMIVHRDLKPDNIMFQEKDIISYSKIKIIDFGAATKRSKPKNVDDEDDDYYGPPYI